MTCTSNKFDWTEPTSNDIEDIYSIRESINAIYRPPDLKTDPKHIQMMDIIYQEFMDNIIITSDHLKLRLDAIRKEIKPKYDLKYGHLNYYYSQGIVSKKYINDIKLKQILKCNLVRENSGVMVFSIFTSPYPKVIEHQIINNEDGSVTLEETERYVFEDKKFSCKFDCAMCPDVPDQPRSYPKEEPGVMRATQNNHDPIRQFIDRAEQYISQGHHIDKCEVIIQGGTWDSYPYEYREQFIRDIFYVANNLDNIFDFKVKYLMENLRNDDLMMKEFKKNIVPNTIEKEINNNVTALVRIIGLTPETRPDQVKPENLQTLRKFGVTRVQLGIQHINDKILRRINRGCYHKHTIEAIKLLKDCGFKVDGHFMPDLPKPLNVDESFDMIEEDKKMFEAINTDPDMKIDQVKVYPCMVTPFARIQKWYDEGTYKPYGENLIKPENYHRLSKDGKILFRKTNPLYNLISEFCINVHPSIRINRIIRDIPANIVTGGTKEGGMRSQIEMDLDKLGTKCRCIRCRECQNHLNKHNIYDDVQLNILPYMSSGGLEFFLSFESNNLSEDYRNKHIHSFLRLRLSKDAGKCNNTVVFPELVGVALIRELHTYGQVMMTGKTNKVDASLTSQHKGYGKRLMKVAEYISHQFGFEKIAVIAGVGVRQYYHKLGYEDEGIGCYQTKKLPPLDSIQLLADDISILQNKYLLRLEKYYKINELDDFKIDHFKIEDNVLENEPIVNINQSTVGSFSRAINYARYLFS